MPRKSEVGYIRLTQTPAEAEKETAIFFHIYPSGGAPRHKSRFLNLPPHLRNSALRPHGGARR